MTSTCVVCQQPFSYVATGNKERLYCSPDCKKNKPRPTAPLHPPGQGSVTDYRRHCPCDECRAAHAAYCRDYASRRKLTDRKTADEEIVAVLAKIAESDVTGDPVTLGRLSTRVLSELDRRLSDGKIVAGLPNTQLLQFAKELLKVPMDDTANMPRDPTVTDIVQAVNLPPERKLELLRQEQTYLEEQQAACLQALHEVEAA